MDIIFFRYFGFLGPAFGAISIHLRFFGSQDWGPMTDKSSYDGKELDLVLGNFEVRGQNITRCEGVIQVASPLFEAGLSLLSQWASFKPHLQKA